MTTNAQASFTFLPVIQPDMVQQPLSDHLTKTKTELMNRVKGVMAQASLNSHGGVGRGGEHWAGRGGGRLEGDGWSLGASSITVKMIHILTVRVSCMQAYN
jgi:hypothetical protein